MVQNFGNVLETMSDDRYAAGIINGYVLLAFRLKGNEVGEIISKNYALPIVNQIISLRAVGML